MLRQLLRDLRPLLPRSGGASAALLALESFFAGVLEAMLLVLVVAVALSVAGNGGPVDLGLPVLGRLQLAPGPSLALAAAFGMVVLVIHVHSSRLTARLSGQALQAARDRAISAFTGASWDQQASEREGSLQETVSTLSLQTAQLVIGLSTLASAAVALFTLLIAALIIDPLVTLVVVVFGALLFAAVRPVAMVTRRRASAYVSINSSFSEAVSQWSSLAMELRAFGVEEAEARRLSDHNERTAIAFARSRFVTRLGSWLLRDLAVLFLVGAAAVLYVIGNADLPAVGAVVLIIVRSLSYAQNANAALQQINEQTPNLESLLSRLETLEGTAQPAGAAELSAISRVELHDVGYAYGPDQPAIEGITFDISAGEAVGVIGPSGGGKTTLVQVLLRLRPPTSGTVTVSGVPYMEIKPSCWHNLVALVPQEPRLFQGSVAENIAFLRSEITRAQVERAAAQAHVLDDIRRLPKGFDTELGPRGAGLSGGQKQRIAIARALVGMPDLLILDEPTSALDVRSEGLLQRTIEDLKGDVTLVIVAHRLTTLACCDRVIAMADGHIRAIGSLDEALRHVSLDEFAANPKSDS